MGDVKGAWSNSQPNTPKYFSASYSWDEHTIVAIGDTITVPFSVDQQDILACDLLFKIMESDVEFLDIQKTPVSQDFTLFHNIVLNCC